MVLLVKNPEFAMKVSAVEVPDTGIGLEGISIVVVLEPPVGPVVSLSKQITFVPAL